MSNVPGMSIRSILQIAPDAALRDFIGAPTISVLTALNPELLTRENLVKLAYDSADPLEMVRNRDVRARLLNLLPLPKAEELGRKFGVSAKGAALYDALVAQANDRKWEPALLSFLGVVIPDRAPTYGEEATRDITPTYGLFEHQRRVVHRVTAILGDPPHKVLVHMPTGAGKTRTAMHVVAQALNQNPDRLVIWLAQSGELLEQAASEFEKAWSALGSLTLPVHRFWGPYDPDIGAAKSGFLVAGLAKMHALYQRDANMIMRLGDRATLTVIDEAHQAIAPTYKAIISYLHEKKPTNELLGLTATPGRTWADVDADIELSKFFDNRKVTLEIEGYTNPVQYLIDEGYLARPTFETLNAEAGQSLSDGDLKELADQHEIPTSVLEQLAANDQRNIKIITVAEGMKTRHSRIIIFAATVTHAHLISSVLNMRGTRSFVITGFTDKATRDRVITKFKSSDPDPLILCNFGVLTTGFDAPKTSAAIIARPTRSLVLYSQMVGRAIRGSRAGGNTSAEIVTVVDPQLPGFGSIADAFTNWEDVWNNA